MATSWNTGAFCMRGTICVHLCMYVIVNHFSYSFLFLISHDEKQSKYSTNICIFWNLSSAFLFLMPCSVLYFQKHLSKKKKTQKKKNSCHYWVIHTELMLIRHSLMQQPFNKSFIIHTSIIHQRDFFIEQHSYRIKTFGSERLLLYIYVHCLMKGSVVKSNNNKGLFE